jgi:hypothetical protein
MQEDYVKWGTRIFIGLIVLGGGYEIVSYLGALGQYTYPPSVVNYRSTVIDGHPVFEATLRLNGWDAGDTDLSAISADMQDLIKHELDAGITDQSMLFHISGNVGGGYDDYGHPRPTALVGAFDLTYSMDDLKRIDWDHTTEYSLFNLAHVSNINSSGDKVGKKYCEANHEAARVFCDSF